MRLRHQLWLVSLILLCLPWAGCQFVKETESAMLASQQRTLMATARAVSLRLGDDPSLGLSSESVSPDLNPIYFYALDEAPVLDGFDEEWRNFDIEPSPIIAQERKDESVAQATIFAGVFRDVYYFLLRIPDLTIDPQNPATDLLRSGDHLIFHRLDQPDLFLGASAPGNVSAKYLEAGQIRTEYGLAGVWNHDGLGYVIELRLRSRLLDETLGLSFYSVDHTGEQSPLEIGLLQATPQKYISASSEISRALWLFAENGPKLSVVDNQGWLRGQAGSLEESVYAGDQLQTNVPLFTKLYQIILRDESAPHLENWTRTGRIAEVDVVHAISGEPAIALFREGNRKVARSSVPLYREGVPVGAVIAEQTSDSLTTSANTAFNRLFFWSLTSIAAVGAALLLFAAFLSYRIRKLSQAADQMVGKQGLISSEFPVSRLPDEIGDLSRSFDQLLSQLGEYTEYLKTLSSKLSHELKTPLAIVRSSLDNLEQQQLDQDSKAYLARASDGAARLSAIFAALTGASRLEEIIRSSEFEILDLKPVLEEVYSAYVGAYPDAKLRLDVANAPAQICICAAPELVVQLLDKLVDNAVSFCSLDGEVTIALSQRGKMAELSVSNDGPVLPEEMKGQLFDSLVSVRKRNPDELHLGLGLHIVKLIAESHGGSARLENRPEAAGVISIVELPVVV